jgi:uncharacterized damage-inducible protein DinB
MSGVIGAAGLKRMFAYTHWANGAILDATAVLDHEQLTRDLRSSFPSVHRTLLHIAESDWIWLRRWQGESPTAPPDWRAGTHADVRARWEEVMRERQAFLAPLDDHAMLRRVRYRRLDRSEHESALWELLLHVVNHSTYHHVPPRPAHHDAAPARGAGRCHRHDALVSRAGGRALPLNARAAARMQRGTAARRVPPQAQCSLRPFTHSRRSSQSCPHPRAVGRSSGTSPRP